MDNNQLNNKEELNAQESEATENNSVEEEAQVAEKNITENEDKQSSENEITQETESSEEAKAENETEEIAETAETEEAKSESEDTETEAEEAKSDSATDKPAVRITGRRRKAGTGHKRILQGKVVSDKADKTIVVLVDRLVAHPIYKKYYKQSKKFMAHDEENTCGIGDTVRIKESRPLSARKRWRLLDIVERAK